MNLNESNESFFIDGLPVNFPVIAGFSKPAIEGAGINNDIDKIFNSERFNDHRISYLNQVHGSFVYEADKPGIYTADGLITRAKNLVIVVKTADCLPIFVFDNKNKKIGVIHMGWRSAKSGILDNIDIDFKHSCVVAGVGLRKCCYEVKEEFLRIKILSHFIEERNGKFYLDIIGFVKYTLFKRGLRNENFYDLGICSFCSKYNFFSYRRDKTVKRTLSFSVIK